MLGRSAESGVVGFAVVMGSAPCCPLGTLGVVAPRGARCLLPPLAWGQTGPRVPECPLEPGWGLKEGVGEVKLCRGRSGGLEAMEAHPWCRMWAISLWVSAKGQSVGVPNGGSSPG